MAGYLDFMILGMLVAIAGLVMLSNALRVPPPILLLLGGLALGVIPGVPSIDLPPNLVLLIFLPPILYGAASFSSPGSLKANLRPIAFLAIGLVALTTVTVAVVAHAMIGLPWSAGFVLGAILSPTDPVAATAVTSRLGAPRQIVTILEGESLVNDGVALVLYHVTVAAVVYGSFSLLDAMREFVIFSIGGVAIGLLAGWIIARVRWRVQDRLVEMTISLFTSYAAYIPAHAAGVSGVLATVAAGLYLGWYSPKITVPRSRLQIFEIWEVLPFLLNSTLFILIGLQLPNVLNALSDQHATVTMFLYAALISLVVIGTRLFWSFPMAYLPRLLSRRLRKRSPYPSWQYLIMVGYVGLRGAVSLAAALAVPLTVQEGTAFPGRDLILFITFCVILFTLVPQGLSLPLLIRRLGLAGREDAEQREETEARLRAAEAALNRIDELEAEDWVSSETVARMRDLYEYRRRRFAARGADEPETNDYEKQSLAFQRFRRELLIAERTALLQLRREGHISDEIRRRVERELDLEDAHLKV